MNKEQAIAILIQVAHDALKGGVFKDFNQTNAVNAAIQALTQNENQGIELPKK